MTVGGPFKGKGRPIDPGSYPDVVEFGPLHGPMHPPGALGYSLRAVIGIPGIGAGTPACLRSGLIRSGVMRRLVRIGA